MTHGFSITYELITEESAESGEPKESGFAMENISLSDALDFLRWKGGYVEANEWPASNPSWFIWYGEQNYLTGDYMNYSLHVPKHMTASSRKRLARYLGIRFNRN